MRTHWRTERAQCVGARRRAAGGAHVPRERVGLACTARLGAKRVPGRRLTECVYAPFEREGVTFSAGVPTVWLGLVNHAIEHDLAFTTFRRTVILPALMDTLMDRFGIEVVHAWWCRHWARLTLTRTRRCHQRRSARCCASRGTPSMASMNFVDDAAWHHASWCHVWAPVREGAVSGVFPRRPADAGRCRSDRRIVATIDADGYLAITDRSRDVIKSGGEWIGTINVAMAHPAVLQRPASASRTRNGRAPAAGGRAPARTTSRATCCINWFARWRAGGRRTMWCLRTACTGKIQKNRLRQKCTQHRLPAETRCADAFRGGEVELCHF